MATIVGVRCGDGVVLGGDRILVRNGQVASRTRQHVFDLDGVGVAAVGSDVDRFVDRLDGELRTYRYDHDTVSLEALERIASDVTSTTGVNALVATRDDEGRVALRRVSADGSVLSDSPMALGSGASLALGQLETAEVASVSAAESFVTELFDAVAERDPGTGDAVDVWTLADAVADD